MNDKHRIEYLRPFFRRYNTIKLLVLLLVVVVFSKKAKAQQALQIGEQLTLQQAEVQSLPQLQQALKSSKAMVLIFWNPQCKEARQQFKHYQRLQQYFQKDIQFITISATAVLQKAENSNLLCLQDTTLAQLFPHRIKPHAVWLDKQHYIKAISHADDLDSLQLSHLISAKALAVPTKIDQNPALLKQPFLKSRTSVNPYYSTLLGHQQGFSPAFGVEADSLQGTIRTWVVNFPLYKLYLMSIGRFLGYPPNQVLWKVKNRWRYQVPDTLHNQEAWNRHYSYSYESILPIHTPANIRLSRMLADINHFTGMHCRLESRTVKVWLLKSTGPAPLATGGRALNTLSHQGHKRLENEYIKALVYELNKEESNPPVIDATHWKQPVSIKLGQLTSFKDLASLNQALAPNHLVLEEAQQAVTFLIIEENP
ncbi:hypothetical protein [Pedobacter glucosidilyticus]|uniref:hypothetical protein n=1 Tax=Pedobacter glucosidilyticus TaxID=1122941 RepID=UPI0026F07055|nr:hypothetical protein [Pedobacter glucosidilyticus]